jgi:hypothetical protein
MASLYRVVLYGASHGPVYHFISLERAARTERHAPVPDYRPFRFMCDTA